MKLYFITSNKNKLREAREILTEHEIMNNALKLTEIQADPVDIAKHKAKEAYQKLKKPCFIEDSALCFNALNGLPGEYIKFFLDRIGNENLYKMLEGFEDKTGYALCLIAYCDGKNINIFEGKVNGTIVKPAGNSGFGWDPLFMPNSCNKTYAGMTSKEKNLISHRRLAFEKFKEFIRGE